MIITFQPSGASDAVTVGDDNQRATITLGRWGLSAVVQKVEAYLSAWPVLLPLGNFSGPFEFTVHRSAPDLATLDAAIAFFLTQQQTLVGLKGALSVSVTGATGGRVTSVYQNSVCREVMRDPGSHGCRIDTHFSFELGPLTNSTS